ncbi:MAG: hypothetical protein AAF611_01965 [Bacteroidota bacterium]
MKKQQLKTLRLNKKSISNFTQNSIVGGTFVSCPGVGICGITDKTLQPCESVECTADCTAGCPTEISCDPVGLCPRRD